LIETSHGLLLGPLNPERKDDDAILYFRPAGQGAWQARALPGKRCFYLQRERDSTDTLRLYCDQKFFTSTDAGRTWSEKVATAK